MIGGYVVKGLIGKGGRMTMMRGQEMPQVSQVTK